MWWKRASIGKEHMNRAFGKSGPVRPEKLISKSHVARLDFQFSHIQSHIERMTSREMTTQLDSCRESTSEASDSVTRRNKTISVTVDVPIVKCDKGKTSSRSFLLKWRVRECLDHRPLSTTTALRGVATPAAENRIKRVLLTSQNEVH